MQRQQSEVSASTRYRYEHSGRNQMIGEYMTFKNQYQNILQNSKIQELKQIYPHGILGRNEENHVVVLDRIGLIKSNQLFKVVDDEAIIGYTFHRLIYLAQHALAPKQKVVWIFDLGGKIMQLASKKSYGILERIISQSQKYFPGLLHKLYFINTPMLFDTIWNKISESINEATLSKMVHLTDDLQQLTGDASPSLLPEYLGGDQSDEILHKIDNIQNEAQVVKAHHNEESDDNQEPEVDFSSLKMALSGLKLGGNHSSQSVAQTPLNTQADDTK